MICYVEASTYDQENGVARLHLASEHCCDMSGCVDYFERRDPNVQRIETYSGGKLDTIYVRRAGRWLALEPAP